MKKRVLILGITGQDGSTLAKQLIDDGSYEVIGMMRRTSSPSTYRIEKLQSSGKLSVVIGDVTDLYSVYGAISLTDPDYIYNFADQDAVYASHAAPTYQTNVGLIGTQNVLHAVRMSKLEHKTRVFIPSSATVFGHSDSPQGESHHIKPNSPYAIAKAGAMFTAEYYRRRYDMFVSVGIMYNHVDGLRSTKYLAPKIAYNAVAYHLGKIDRFECYKPDLMVDIGWAPEYTLAARMMLEADDKPRTYAVGTGVPYSIRNLWLCALQTIYSSAPYEELNDRANQSLCEVTCPDDPETLIADPILIHYNLGWKASENAYSVVSKLTKLYLTDPLYSQAIIRSHS